MCIRDSCRAVRMRKFILQNKEFTEMNLTTVREIYRSRETYLDKEVQIGGWVRSVRGSKNFGFIVVSDGSYFETLQVVYHDTCLLYTSFSENPLQSLYKGLCKKSNPHRTRYQRDTQN